LNSSDIVCIRTHAALADRAGWLQPEQQQLIHTRGWLRMLAPRAVGGAELPLPQVVRLEEEIAAIDGSMGWVVTLCAGAGWFCGFMPPDFARRLLGTANVCLAGSGAPTGTADMEGDEFVIHGRWDFASGAPMATHFTMNAILRQHGRPVLDAAGQPRVRAFVLPAADVEVLPTWRSIGMRASASHSYAVNGKRAAAEQAFDIDAAHATAAGPLYRFPFYPLAYVTLAANLAGMAHHFIALARQAIARRKHAATGRPLLEQATVQALLQAAGEQLAMARERAYALLDQGWAQVAQGGTMTEQEVLALQDAALALVAAARQAVDGLYPYCGLYAAHMDSDISRVWRDFHTATQHALLLP
jgi:alkylation response protein AidB-like acyl-CoA dehydrogenase